MACFLQRLPNTAGRHVGRAQVRRGVREEPGKARGNRCGTRDSAALTGALEPAGDVRSRSLEVLVEHVGDRLAERHAGSP